MSFRELEFHSCTRHRKDAVKIVVVQLRVESGWFRRQDHLSHLDTTLAKLPDGSEFALYLETILSNHCQSADLVIFPELSVPARCLDALKDISKQNDQIIIAGTHYASSMHGGWHSVSPILAYGERVDTQKLIPSPLELSAVKGKGVVKGTKAIFLRETKCGSLAIPICSDFLDESYRQQLLSHNPDIVCIIACQNDRKKYHTLASQLVENSKIGAFCLFCNLSWDSEGSKVIGDAGSAIFGQMDKRYLEQLADSGYTDSMPQYKVCEAVARDSLIIAATLDLTMKKPNLVRTIDSKPNIRDVLLAPATSPVLHTKQKHGRKFRVVAFDLDGTLLRGLQFSWTLVWQYLGYDDEIRRGLMRQFLKNDLSYDRWCQEACDHFMKNDCIARRSRNWLLKYKLRKTCESASKS